MGDGDTKSAARRRFLRGARELSRRAAGQSLLRSGLALSVSRLLSFVTGFLALGLFGSLFSKREIAVIHLYEMVATLLLSFGFNWSSVALVRYGREELLERGTMHGASNARGGLLLPILGVGLTLLAVFADPLLRYIGSSDRTLIAFLVAELILSAAFEQNSSLLTAAEQHAKNAALHVCASGGRLLLLLLFWAGVIDISAESYVKLLVGLRAALVVAQGFLLERPWILPVQVPSLAEVRRMARFAAPQIYGFVALYVVQWADISVLRLYRGMEEVGGYQFLYTIFAKIAALSFLLNTLFFPRLITWNWSDPDQVLRYVRTAPWLVLGSTGLATIVALVAAEPVMALLFADKFASTLPAFRLLLAAVPFVFLTYVYVPLLSSRDQLRQVQFANVCAAVVNVAVDLLLVPKVGVMGAGWATFLALQIRTVLILVAGHRALGVPYTRLLAACGGGFAAATAYFLAASPVALLPGW